MEVSMKIARNQGRARLSGALIAGLALASPLGAAATDLPAAGPGPDPSGMVQALAEIHPDYRLYVASVRALPVGISRRLYMALVRPGADDPAGRNSAPIAGIGARNDIVYDEEAVVAGHGPAWRYLLLSHEYFHARHLAEATRLPIARGSGVELERHYNEAAAWGFNVAEARAGRYPGLLPEEFREALDRYGEHYAALKALMKKSDPERWRLVADLLLQPEALFTTTGSPLSRGPGRLSGLGQAPAIP
jgi:hypothetical protein